MELKTQQERAAAFREMHFGPKILILPNAWDVASARIFEAVGFGAIGTTSAGVAASLGYPDGERVPLEEMLRVVRRISESVMMPATADIQAGYGATEGAVADLEAGADCIFVPGLGDAGTIATLVREIAGPINILAGRNVPTIPELAEMGVARVSVGSGLMRAALALVRSAAEELLSAGTYTSFTEHTFSYAELNKMLVRG